MFNWSDLQVRVDIKEVFEGERMQFPDSGHMKRIRFDDPASVEYESHTGKVLSEYMVILSNDPREFYYEFQFSEADIFPKKVHFQGKGVER